MKPKNSTSPALEIWGLTGGIASGKSSVAGFLEEAGAHVIDADRISRDLSRKGGRAHARIVERFGTADRAALRKIVFADPKARQDLEGILHPMIGEESRKRMHEIAAKLPPGQVARFVYEATLIIEAGRKKELTGLIVVEAPLEARLAWLEARDGASQADARKILAAQLSDEERRKHADHVIVNRGSLEDLKRESLALGRKIGIIP
ncbi:MAG TPA: dephospho-CoA kinase [Bdellovibrionota bacterium]|nr:dephospho-CoA kinase [Bdellovibrionota bacterium]